jgi:hypothetical protein
LSTKSGVWCGWVWCSIESAPPPLFFEARPAACPPPAILAVERRGAAANAPWQPTRWGAWVHRARVVVVFGPLGSWVWITNIAAGPGRGDIQRTAAGTVTYQVCNFPPKKKRAVLVFGSCGSGVWITNSKWNSVGGNAPEGVRRAALGLGRRVKIQPASTNDSRGQRNF